MPKNQLLRISGLGLASLSLAFSAGGVSADAHSPGVKLQVNAEAKAETKAQKKLAIVDNKVNAVKTEIENIKASLGEAPLTDEEVKRYKEYLEEINGLQNRLNGTEKHLAAITKHGGADASAGKIKGLIQKVRSTVLEVKETIDAQLAETMSSSGEVPEGLKAAENPTYKIGSEAIILADHMPGMKGAVATIAGAFDTIAYSVTYYPTTGGEPVKDHKWVIHEEIQNAGEAPLSPGTEVILEADHMKGMKGAKAVIESAVDTTVYMLDFTTTAGEKVENHKWVVESELSPVK